jgi:hypothetical protein
MQVSRSIHIDAPVDRVFALMRNPLARARLNPTVTPLRVEIERNGAVVPTDSLEPASVCHFRLQLGGRIVDYRTTVRELVPERRIVLETDTATPVAITIETGPEGSGTRLTQSERFEPTDAMLLDAAPPGVSARALQFIDELLPFLDLDTARRFHDRRLQLLEEKLGDRLEQWLDAIRRHLELAGGSR